MPNVDVHFKASEISYEECEALEPVLYDVAERHFNGVDDAGKPVNLKPEMLKVRYFEGSERDKNTQGVELRVMVRRFKSRSGAYEAFVEELEIEAASHLPRGVKASVTVILLEAWRNIVGTGPSRDDA